MNVTINRAEMLCAIKRASAIAPADSPLDVLRGVLLEADAAAGKLTVTSTNLEAALEEKLPCTVQEDGALVFGAKMLAEMLSRLPQDMTGTPHSFRKSHIISIDTLSENSGLYEETLAA